MWTVGAIGVAASTTIRPAGFGVMVVVVEGGAATGTIWSLAHAVRHAERRNEGRGDAEPHGS